MDALQADYGQNIDTVRAELESPNTETMLPRVRKLAGVIGKTYVAMTSTGQRKCDNRQLMAPSTTVHCQQLTSGCAYDRRLAGKKLARKSLILLVPEAGIEPARVLPRGILSPPAI